MGPADDNIFEITFEDQMIKDFEKLIFDLDEKNLKLEDKLGII
jgi:hypothetical protein